MTRELSPADLLPALQRVAGALVLEWVLAEARAAAGEREAGEWRNDVAAGTATVPPDVAPEWRPGAGTPADWRNGAAEPARSAGEAP